MSGVATRASDSPRDRTSARLANGVIYHPRLLCLLERAQPSSNTARTFLRVLRPYGACNLRGWARAPAYREGHCRR
jgi:hypothetical protein